MKTLESFSSKSATKEEYTNEPRGEKQPRRG